MAYVKINDEHLTNYANSIRQVKNNNKHYTPEQLEDEIQELAEKTIEQEATIIRQNNTIDQLNRREPKLETLDPINPSQEQITYKPSGDNIGFNTFTVNAPTAAGLNFNYADLKEGVEFLGGVGTYNPFPEQSYGGVYYTELGEGGYPKKILIKNMLKSARTIPQFFNISNDAKRELREVVFENCPMFLTAPQSIFQGFNYLIKVILPDSLTSIGTNAFQNCTSLTELALPDSLTSIGLQAFQGCSRLIVLSIPNSLTSIGTNAFQFCTSLTILALAQGFDCNGLNVSSSTRFTAETIVACLEALADRTGQTAYTITFGTTNLNKLTAEQKAIAINKNWNLA